MCKQDHSKSSSPSCASPCRKNHSCDALIVKNNKCFVFWGFVIQQGLTKLLAAGGGAHFNKNEIYFGARLKVSLSDIAVIICIFS